MKVMEQSATAGKPKDASRAPVYMVGIILLAAALRLYGLGSESLWIDEGFSLRDAANPDPLRETRPLFFLMLHYWINLIPAQTDFLLRLPAAIFGTASVWAFYAVGRRLTGASVAALASVFMAISVLHINHSSEIRYYSFIVLLTLLSTYFMIRAFEEGRARYFATSALFSLASVMTFPLAALTLSAQGAFAVVYARAYRTKSAVVIGGLVAVLAIWVPWLRNNMQSAGAYSQGFTSIIERPDPANTIAMMGRFFLWKWFNPGSVQSAAAFGFSVLVVLVALYGLRQIRRTDTGLVFAWLWLMVPLSGMIVMCYTLANSWMPHYMITASPALFLLVSKGIHSIRSRHIAVAVALLIAVVTMGRLGLYYRRPSRPEWRQAIHYVEAHERPGDVIGVYDPGNRFIVYHYYGGKSRFAPLGDDALTADRLRDWNEAKANRLFADFPETGSRFWLLLSNHTYAGGFHIINYVKKHYRVLDYQSYSMVEIYLFDATGRSVPVEARKGRGDAK